MQFNIPIHDHSTPEGVYAFDARGIAKRFRHAAIFGALDELGMQWVLSRKARRFTVDQTARAVADTFLHGIVRAPQPASQEVS